MNPIPDLAGADLRQHQRRAGAADTGASVYHQDDAEGYCDGKTVFCFEPADGADRIQLPHPFADLCIRQYGSDGPGVFNGMFSGDGGLLRRYRDFFFIADAPVHLFQCVYLRDPSAGGGGHIYVKYFSS